ncbi:MAG: single-stranded DNA-binding protein [Eubacteriales bacterium]|nr:single-stranded DNA-binding protein [Eubacteriales bacterium]
MNKVILMGRLTRDPEVRYSQAAEPLAIARYTLAVDRRFQRKGQGGDEQTADFIQCVAFGRQGEFAEKYLKQGTKIAVTGRIQTGSYTNKDGNKVYTTEVVIEEQEFAESKSNGGGGDFQPMDRPMPGAASADGFMSIPEGIENNLPFK